MQLQEVKLMFGASGEPKSLMSALTATEAEQISKWCKDQPRSATGAIDMMAWPGWAEVMARRKEGTAQNQSPSALPFYRLR